MKTVLVLTDFSQGSRVAADVAIQMAAKLNANILLFNSYKVMPLFPSVEVTTWTMQHYALLMQTSKGNLNLEAERLNSLIEDLPAEFRKPELICMSESGSLAENVRALVRAKDITMVVMGGRKEINANVVYGSDINAVLGKINCPTLIIPETQTITDIKRIVFATDLTGSSLYAINWLTKFSVIYKILIHVRHLPKAVLAGDYEEEDDISECMTAISKLNSTNISFQYIRGNDVARELGTFNKITQEDILAIVHKKHSFIWRLFHANASEGLASHNKTPILIIPESK